MKRILVPLFLLMYSLSLVGCGTTPGTEKEILPGSAASTTEIETVSDSGAPIAKLEIFPASMSVVPGLGVGLTVRGYTENGEPVSQEQMERLSLCWEYRAEDNAFVVDEEGYFTAISEGAGEVWVKSEDGTLLSPAITVVVKGNHE